MITTIMQTQQPHQMQAMQFDASLYMQNIDADIYYKTLCSSGLAFVNKQRQQIEQKRHHLVENKQKLVYSNYDSLIKFSTFSNDLINDFQKLEDSLENLKTIIPDFKIECEEFSHNARDISVRWRYVSSMLAKYPQMIEFLEIPQLLNNCIRTFYYDDALRICNFVTKFCVRHKSMSPIFENMLSEIDKSKDIMIAQILKEMNGNIQLPACIKLIHYLRQTDRFTEEKLRVNFLLARDVWFQASINKSSNVIHSLSYISSITEVFRINIFDIVTQYRAIFPDIDLIDSLSSRGGGSDFSSSIRNESNSSESSNYRSYHKIINSWLLYKIEHYLRLLSDNLSDCVRQSGGPLPLETLLDHCFYFGLSMSKIGADIRPQLIVIINRFVHDRFVARVEDANKRFKIAINNIFKGMKRKESDSNDPQKFVNLESNIENFAPLLAYHNNIVSILNEIRSNVPLCLFASFAKTLNASFAIVVKCLRDYIRQNEYSLNGEEFEYFVRFCYVCQNALLPSLHRYFQQLCPISAVSQRFSVTTSELSKLEAFKSLELDIKTPIDAIAEIIAQILSKNL